MRPAFLFFLLLSTASLAAAGEVMQIRFDLGKVEKGYLPVEVTPPELSEDTVEWIIPQIIPGTYMKVDFRDLYKEVRCYDRDGKVLKYRWKNNHLFIYRARSLARIQYKVRQSFGRSKVWDNMIPCGGTIFRSRSFLLNYQGISGYFKSREHLPVEVWVQHPATLYGSTSQEAVSRTATLDHFHVSSYAELIDRPVMYSRPDTASFTAGNAVFHIDLHTDAGSFTADSLKPVLKKVFDSMYVFMNGFPMNDYHIMLYYVSTDSLKNIWQKFGVGAALEHRHSFVYVSREGKLTYVLRSLYHIVAHEFLHTWAPLNIHSEKIDRFSFAAPDLSAHLWLYEGITEYMAYLFLHQYHLIRENDEGDLAYSITFAENRKRRSLTETSRHITTGNLLAWPGKMIRLMNFYAQGKMLGFSLDMELTRLSGDTFRLRDLMVRLAENYRMGRPLSEEKLFDELAALSYPGVKTFLEKYAAGKELPPYQKDLWEIGWAYREKGTMIPAFGNFKMDYDPKNARMYFKEAGRNTLGYRKGDSIMPVASGKIYMKLYYPLAGDTVSITVKRGADTLQLTGYATLSAKVGYEFIDTRASATAAQQRKREYFFRPPQALRVKQE